MQPGRPAVFCAGKQPKVLHVGSRRIHRLSFDILPVKVRREGVVVQWPAKADMMEQIKRPLFWVVSVLAIHGDTIAVNKFEQRHNPGTELAWPTGVVILAAAYPGEALKEIAVRYRPFAAAFAPEHAKHVASI